MGFYFKFPSPAIFCIVHSINLRLLLIHSLVFPRLGRRKIPAPACLSHQGETHCYAPLYPSHGTVQTPMSGSPGEGGLLWATAVPHGPMRRKEITHCVSTLDREASSFQGKDLFTPIIQSGNWDSGLGLQSA